MRKKRFAEHQIIKALKQVEGGRSAVDVCREYRISKATQHGYPLPEWQEFGPSLRIIISWFSLWRVVR